MLYQRVAKRQRKVTSTAARTRVRGSSGNSAFWFATSGRVSGRRQEITLRFARGSGDARVKRLQIHRREVLRGSASRGGCGEIVIVRGIRPRWKLCIGGTKENSVNVGDDDKQVARNHEYSQLGKF